MRQRAPTANFIFRPPEALSRLSQITDWQPGDCLLTGTPGGVALTLTPETQDLLRTHLFDDPGRRRQFVADQKMSGQYLEVGDTVELSIKSSDGAIDLGRQICRVTAE